MSDINRGIAPSCTSAAHLQQSHSDSMPIAVCEVAADGANTHLNPSTQEAGPGGSL